jgi:hypothetical protein
MAGKREKASVRIAARRQRLIDHLSPFKHHSAQPKLTRTESKR